MQTGPARAGTGHLSSLLCRYFPFCLRAIVFNRSYPVGCSKPFVSEIEAVKPTNKLVAISAFINEPTGHRFGIRPQIESRSATTNGGDTQGNFPMNLVILTSKPSDARY